jgi:DNA-binding response OmpR family regulator
VLARIKVVLRRRPRVQSPAEPPEPASAPYRYGDIEINTRTREVLRQGELIEMTATEFDILETLARADGSVLSRTQIFERVWGPNHHGTPRTIDNFMAQLRQKLEPDSERPQHIVTVRGVGYRLSR